jgi:hypothetical protein
MYSVPSIENVHERDGKDIRLLGAGEIRDVGVERDLLLLLDRSHQV